MMSATTAFPCGAESVLQQIFGRAVARMRGAHRRRREAEDTDRAGLTLRVAREGMRIVRETPALRARRFRDQHPAALDLDAVGGHAIRLVAGLAFAGLPVELVVMPGTDDEITVEPATTERTADMIADTGDRAEPAVPVRQRDALRADPQFLHRPGGEFLARTDVDPLLVAHRTSPLRSSFRTTSFNPDQVSDTAQTFMPGLTPSLDASGVPE
jgi:hypothetical protein